MAGRSTRSLASTVGTLHLNSGEAGVASALLRAGARIMVVGGHAVMFHGHLRPTKDLDLFVLASAENAAKVAAGLRSLGLNIPPEIELGLAQPCKQVPLPPPYSGVELLTSIKGVEFLDAEVEASVGFAGESTIPVISVRHLITSKAARGEPKDNADIEALRSICAG